MLVIDAKVHQQVRRQLLELEVGAFDVELGLVAHMLQQPIDQTAVAELGGLNERLRRVRQRHQPRARALMQGLDEREHLVLQHARHEPLAAVLVDLVQRIDRHGHGHAVLGVARRVQVARGAIHAAEPDRLRERVAGDAGRLMAHQLLARQQQQARLAFHLVAVPTFQRVTAAHIRRQPRVVERVDQLVVDEHVLAARLVLELFDLRDQLAVRGDERQLRLPAAAGPPQGGCTPSGGRRRRRLGGRRRSGDQRLADEDLARRCGIDIAEVHASVAVDHDAVERRPLERNHLGGLLLPVRLEQLGLDHVAGDLRQPLRLDRRDAAAEQPRRFDQLGRDDPAPRLLREVRARVLVEADAARAEVPVFVLALEADVAE